MASNFEFYSPTRVIFGKGTEQRVGALVREYGGTRVLIVYGGKSAVRSGVLDRAEKSLAEAGISSWTLGGVVPNPHLDKVYEGIRIGKENSIDFLLAVGGGSVIDTAKAIAYGLAEPEKDVWELYEHTRTARKCLPVASILTIAAAGSETSNSSVITRVDTHQKRAYNDDISRPKFALMDPELTKTLPDYQTESGCADIMMHTMERYFTQGDSLEITDSIAEGLLRTVMAQALNDVDGEIRTVATFMAPGSPTSMIAQPLRQTSEESALSKAETVVTTVAFPMPERQARGAAGCGDDHHTVTCDLLNLPG